PNSPPVWATTSKLDRAREICLSADSKNDCNSEVSIRGHTSSRELAWVRAASPSRRLFYNRLRRLRQISIQGLHKGLWAERLRDVAGAAGHLAANFVKEAVLARDHHDGNFLRRLVS